MQPAALGRRGCWFPISREDNGSAGGGPKRWRFPTRTWHKHLEFGDEEQYVRIFEDAEPEELASEITRRLNKKTDEDDFYVSAARAAVRSTRYEGLGSGRVPRGLFALRSHRELGCRLPIDLRPYPLIAISRHVHAEIHDPLYGPTRLLRFEPYADGSKEEIRDTYLEAVLVGDTDLADHIFGWLIKNMSPEEIADLLWTCGLEKAGLGSFKLTGAVETLHLIQSLGWEHGAVLLRGVVRHQCHRLIGDNPFTACLDRIAEDGMHEKARRRLPGERGRGEDDPGGVWSTALQWASSAPDDRTILAARLLAGEWTLEDYWEAVCLGSAILFLGASSSGLPAARAAQMVVAVHGLHGMIRHGNLGQKILASLLVGRTPEFADVDCSWVDAGVHLLEGGLRASKVSPDQLGAALDGWQAEAALACVATTSADPSGLANLIPVIDHRLAFLHGLEGIGPLFHLAQCEAFENGRSPHRWVHLAASAWLCAVWPDRGLLDEKSLAELSDRRRKTLARKPGGR